MKFRYRLMMPGELTSLVTVYQKNQAALGWTAAAHPVGQSKPLTNFRTVRDTGWHQSFRTLNLHFKRANLEIKWSDRP